MGHYRVDYPFIIFSVCIYDHMGSQVRGDRCMMVGWMECVWIPVVCRIRCGEKSVNGQTILGVKLQ